MTRTRPDLLRVGEEIFPPDIKDFDGADGEALCAGLRIPTRRGAAPDLPAQSGSSGSASFSRE